MARSTASSAFCRRTSLTSRPSLSRRSRPPHTPVPRWALSLQAQEAAGFRRVLESSRRTTSATFSTPAATTRRHRGQDFQAGQQQGYELRVIGIAKTIDNDLPSPTLPRLRQRDQYICTTVREVSADNAAWARRSRPGHRGHGPQRGLDRRRRLPGQASRHPTIRRTSSTAEVPFTVDKFVADVKRVLAVRILLDRRGEGWSMPTATIFPPGPNRCLRPCQLGGAGNYLLASSINTCRHQGPPRLPGIAQRAAAHCSSKTTTTKRFSWARRP